MKDHRISSLTRFNGRLGSRHIYFCRDCGCTHDFLLNTDCRSDGFGHDWVSDGPIIPDDPVIVDGAEGHALVECVTCTICKEACIRSTIQKSGLVLYVLNSSVNYPSFKCSSIRMVKACT